MATEEMKKRGMVTMVIVLITGAAGALWLGLKALINQH